MTVGDGKFVLYANIAPVLGAGDYRFTSTHTLDTATGPSGSYDNTELPVAGLATHVRVRSPRYFLPPDQVLSTYPPANTEGSYGMRLPQVVIKRRTLPWERPVVTGRPDIPSMALVLIAEGEAQLMLNQPVAQCVTADRPLAGVADAELGNYLSVAKSKIDEIFPTQLDVPLLAHARQVDINDTELMLGDDDGFLAVVISNRLPLAATDADGNELPVKYLACLVNLEGQFDRLRPTSPTPHRFTSFPAYSAVQYASAAQYDRAVMHLADAQLLEADLGVMATEAAPRYTIGATQPRLSGAAATSAGASGAATAAAWGSVKGLSSSDIYVDMASGFNSAVFTELDPVYRFPVLMYWSFTSIGETTFRLLMEQLDSGLLGTTPEPDAGHQNEPPAAGRPPLELVETGHVGLPHATRVGDDVRCWFRGPLVAHPTTDEPDGRLPLAHASDQLRVVVPDGREDLSLASAFEIGRLLALARPSITAALLRWRQTAYLIARDTAVWADIDAAHFGGLLGQIDPTYRTADLGRFLQGALVGSMVTAPELVVGAPSPIVKAGRSIADLVGDPAVIMARGFGLPAGSLKGPAERVLNALAEQPVPTGIAKSTIVDQHVAAQLDSALASLVADVLGDQVEVKWVDRGRRREVRAVPGKRRRRDALDHLLNERRGAPDGETER
jgi:hypothetical protein